MPGTEEQDRCQRADHEHRSVLGHEEDAPPQPGIFGVESGNQFTFGFRQIERRSIHAGHRTRKVDGENDQHRERIMEDEPVGEQSGLHVPDR